MSVHKVQACPCTKPFNFYLCYLIRNSNKTKSLTLTSCLPHLKVKKTVENEHPTPYTHTHTHPSGIESQTRHIEALLALRFLRAFKHTSNQHLKTFGVFKLKAKPCIQFPIELYLIPIHRKKKDQDAGILNRSSSKTRIKLYCDLIRNPKNTECGL